MRIFILLGHPNKDTLSGHLADVYETAAKAAGHEVRRTNIGDLQFDPILHKGYREIQQLEPDLIKVQQDMTWAQHFVFVYPLWWSSVPALTKGLIDRIFLPRFAFSFHKDGLGWDQLLKGRTARVITLSKSSPFFIWFLFGDFTNEISRATLGFAGYRVSLTTVGNSEKLSDAAKAHVERKIARLAKHAR